MKFLPIFGLVLILQVSIHQAHAQEKNPLINSGELIARGSDLYDSGEYKRSIDLYSKVGRNDTNYVRALYELAMSCYADSQFAKSAHYCEMALAVRDALNSPLIRTRRSLTNTAMRSTPAAIRKRHCRYSTRPSANTPATLICI